MNDYEQLESSQRQHQNEMLFTAKMDNEYEKHCLDVVHSLGLTPKKDGNMWCILLGENLQDGISGFGETVINACLDFYHALNSEEKRTC